MPQSRATGVPVTDRRVWRSNSPSEHSFSSSTWELPL